MKKESLSLITIKTLLAVVIFTGIGTIIIGGGYLIGDYYKNKSGNQLIKPVVQEVTITTDKTEYEQGENTIITIRNNFDKNIYYYENVYCYLEYQKENGIWVQSLIINMPCLKGEIKELYSFKSTNRTLYFTGNNHIYYSGGGKYRLAFSYGYSNKNTKEKTIYSNEFTVKKKDETADWKIYRNEEYGFEVKYPNQEDYTIEHYPNNIITFSDVNIKTEQISISQPHPGNRININIATDKMYVDYLQSDGAFKEKIINKNKFYEFHRIGMGQGYGYMIQRNSNYYVLESIWGPENKDFEMIVKTFKFIEKDETADWKTYRNEEYGFEIKYPEDTVIISEEVDKIKIGVPTLNAEIYKEYLLIGVRKNSNSNCSNPLSTIIQETETVTSNDIEFVKETGTEGVAGSFYKSISYSTLKNNSCFNLSFVVLAKSADINVSQEEKTFNQILSTFKFVE